MNRFLRCVVAIGLSVGPAILAGCARQAPPPPPPPPTVTVSRPLQRDVADYEEYPGRTAAVDSVQIRARVSGYLERVNFKEGTEVKKGEVLYEIDPRPYQFALKQAEAQVRLQEAQVRFAEAVYQRNVKASNAGQVISVEEVQQSQAQRDTAQGQLEANRASAEQARLNLAWTKVEAPIDGLAGRTLVTPGNLIVADQTMLTTIVSQDPMYAYFEVDEATVQHVQQLIREGKLPSAREAASHIPVYLSLATETGFPHEGYLDFVSNQVQPSTATLQIRARFPNPRPEVGPRVLTPGEFVRVRVQVGPTVPALLVTQAALGMDQNLHYVYVLDDKNQVVRRDVQLGRQEEGGLQVVKEGLQPTDRVIVEGIQHVRPGMTVNPQEVPMPVAGANNPNPPAKRQ
jgi:RND family efflux transporter MFP subunit